MRGRKDQVLMLLENAQSLLDDELALTGKDHDTAMALAHVSRAIIWRERQLNSRPEGVQAV